MLLCAVCPCGAPVCIHLEGLPSCPRNHSILQRMFLSPDRDFRNLMATIGRNPTVASLVQSPHLAAKLRTVEARLTSLMYTQGSVVNRARRLCPSLFLLPDAPLLQLLSAGARVGPQALQPYVHILFGGNRLVVVMQRAAPEEIDANTPRSTGASAAPSPRKERRRPVKASDPSSSSPVPNDDDSQPAYGEGIVYEIVGLEGLHGTAALRLLCVFTPTLTATWFFVVSLGWSPRRRSADLL